MPPRRHGRGRRTKRSPSLSITGRRPSAALPNNISQAHDRRDSHPRENLRFDSPSNGSSPSRPYLEITQHLHGSEARRQKGSSATLLKRNPLLSTSTKPNARSRSARNYHAQGCDGMNLDGVSNLLPQPQELMVVQSEPTSHLYPSIEYDTIPDPHIRNTDTLTSPTPLPQPHPPHRSPPTPLSLLSYQTPLFQALEQACLGAASAFYHSQDDSPMNEPTPQPPLPHPLTSNHPTQYARHRSANQPLPANLTDHLAHIADMLWTRAVRCGDHAAEYEAVRQMANLYRWGETVVAAVRDTRFAETREEMRGVVVAARELTAFLMDERAVALVDELWGGLVGGGG